ncbi:hypothetical protein G9A89_006942 [Geosiphon pyriformis]|nr:hypothetical protein G9A89_006942 [Geosiphon pyriformis]
MTNIHDNKKKKLSIAKAVPVCINGISIETNMKVSEAKKYIIIVGNKWLKKAKTLLNYEFCELIIRCEEPLIENLARKPNTVIGGMFLVPDASTINLCILLVMNASPA